MRMPDKWKDQKVKDRLEANKIHDISNPNIRHKNDKEVEKKFKKK